MDITLLTNLKERFCLCLSASETMKAEASGLIDYLNVCGIPAEAFLADFLKKNAIGFISMEESRFTKKEGSRLLGLLRNEVCALYPDVRLEYPDKNMFTENDQQGISVIQKPYNKPFCKNFNKKFSKIYLEHAAADYALTKNILSRFPKAEIIPINHYKDIFNAAGQDFIAQKRSPALILAVNNGRRIYDGARPCQSFGHEHFYYTSQVKNCLYDCEYCFLRGMYPSGSIVIFVNLEDYFTDIDSLLKEHPVYLSIAYDTDLLCFEGFTGLVESWINFAGDRPALLLELRTKCASKQIHEIIDNGLLSDNAKRSIILAYTISPDPVAKAFEHGASGFEARKKALYASLEKGIRTRLCIDPVLAVKDWENIYGKMLELLFENPLCTELEDISVGSFRISKGYLKAMRQKALTPLSAYPYSLKNGMSGYDDALVTKIRAFFLARIGGRYPKEKIFFPYL